MRKALTLLSLLLLSLQSQGQQPGAASDHEFPALQFLPVGTVVEGISIPRYEKHKVTALMLAKSLEVKSRTSVELRGLSASLYSNNNEQTDISTGSVTYSFSTKVASTAGDAQVQDPRFSAKGKGVIFSTSSRKGFLHGPVSTSISAKLFNRKKSSQK